MSGAHDVIQHLPQTITASVLFRGVGPTPPRPALRHLAAEIAVHCNLRGLKPVTLRGRSYRAADRDKLARLSIDCECGELKVPLITWYEWQHPQWEWGAVAELPSIDGAPLLVAGVVAGPFDARGLITPSCSDAVRGASA